MNTEQMKESGCLLLRGCKCKKGCNRCSCAKCGPECGCVNCENIPSYRSPSSETDDDVEHELGDDQSSTDVQLSISG